MIYVIKLLRAPIQISYLWIYLYIHIACLCITCWGLILCFFRLEVGLSDTQSLPGFRYRASMSLIQGCTLASPTIPWEKHLHQHSLQCWDKVSLHIVHNNKCDFCAVVAGKAFLSLFTLKDTMYFYMQSFLSALQWCWKIVLRRNRSTLIIWKKKVMNSWHLEITWDSFNSVYMARQQGALRKKYL